MLPPGILAKNRARVTNHYALLPEIGIVESVLPNFIHTVAHIQAAPALGRARFVQMLLDMQPGAANLAPINDGLEHFLYVLDGTAQLNLGRHSHVLTEGGYAYLPPEQIFSLANLSESLCRIEWIKRRYEPVGRLAPSPIVGNQKDIACEPGDVEGTQVQRLLPFEDIAFDMAVNILRFNPGVYFDYVETHIMEHGLYMLSGQGIYYLADEWMEVQASDFFWMAPFCPQFFFCTGWEESSYLLYKDVNRDVAL